MYVWADGWAFLSGLLGHLSGDDLKSMSQIVKLSSHSDSAAAADDHDDRAEVLNAELTSVTMPANTL